MKNVRVNIEYMKIVKRPHPPPTTDDDARVCLCVENVGEIIIFSGYVKNK